MRRGWGLENLFQSVILNTPSLKLTFVAFYTNYSRRTRLDSGRSQFKFYPSGLSRPTILTILAPDTRRAKQIAKSSGFFFGRSSDAWIVGGVLLKNHLNFQLESGNMQLKHLSGIKWLVAAPLGCIQTLFLSAIEGRGSLINVRICRGLTIFVRHVMKHYGHQSSHRLSQGIR